MTTYTDLSTLDPLVNSDSMASTVDYTVAQMSTLLDQAVTMVTTMSDFHDNSTLSPFTDLTNVSGSPFENSTDWDYNNSTKVGNRATYGLLLKTVMFYCQAVFLPFICFIGVTGNILNLVVLSRKEMKSSTTCFLIGLAVSDLMLCIVNIPEAVFGVMTATSGMTDFHKKSQRVYTFVSYYLSNVFITCTSWMTISVTLERFIAISLPHRVRLICTVKRARIAIPILFLASLLGHVTKCFEARVHLNLNMPPYRLTELGKNRVYQSVMHWTNISLAVLLPFFFLIIVNSLLVYFLVKFSKSTEIKSSRNLSNSHKNTIHITVAVIAMVTIFIFCHSLGVYTAFNIALKGRAKVYANEVNRSLAMINNMLVVLNSSVNFILYCLISSRFRKMFKLAFCGDRKTKKKPFSTPIVKNVNRYKLSTSSGGTASTSAGSSNSKRRSTSPSVSRNNIKLSQIMNSQEPTEDRKLTLKLSDASYNIAEVIEINGNKKPDNNNKKEDKNTKKTNKDREVEPDNWISPQDTSIELPDVTEPLLKPPVSVTIQRSTSAPDPNLRVATVNKKNLNRNLSDRKALPYGAQRIEHVNPPSKVEKDKETSKADDTVSKEDKEETDEVTSL